MDIGFRKTAGVALVGGGILGFVAGFLHPQGPDGNGSYHATIAGMLSDPKWPAAHWFALVSLAVTAWAVGMLIDTGVTGRSTVAQIGARLLQVGLGVMIVEVAVEIAARHEVLAYAAGSPAPLVDLTQPLKTVGWPLFGIGLALLALGLGVGVPRAVGVLGAIGGAAFALGGVLTMGAHMAGPGRCLGSAPLPPCGRSGPACGSTCHRVRSCVSTVKSPLDRVTLLRVHPDRRTFHRHVAFALTSRWFRREKKIEAAEMTPTLSRRVVVCYRCPD